MFLILGAILRALQLLILARVILSWLPGAERTPIGRLILALSEPFLKPFRGAMLRSGGVGVDFSPMIVLLLLWLVGRMIGV